MRSRPTNRANVIAKVLWLVSLIFTGCEGPEPVTVTTPADSGIELDSSSIADMLADVDASSPDSGLDAVIPSDQFVPEPQGCRVGESAAVLTKPNSARVQVLYAGFESILLWADEDGVHRCDIDRNGAFVGEHRIIQTVVDGMVPTLSTLRVGPFTYVALSYDDEANPIQILRLDRSEVDSIPLINDVDRLSGAAKLTTVEVFWLSLVAQVVPLVGRLLKTHGPLRRSPLRQPEGLFPDDVIAGKRCVFAL